MIENGFLHRLVGPEPLKNLDRQGFDQFGGANQLLPEMDGHVSLGIVLPEADSCWPISTLSLGNVVFIVNNPEPVILEVPERHFGSAWLWCRSVASNGIIQDFFNALIKDFIGTAGLSAGKKDEEQERFVNGWFVAAVPRAHVVDQFLPLLSERFVIPPHISTPALQRFENTERFFE
jgi:hypothetical protein